MRSSYLPAVVQAKYVSDYVLRVQFDDGTRKNIDIAQWFRGPIFEPLRNKAYFKKFYVAAATIAWPNGADISPESLFDAPDASTPPLNRSQRKKRSAVRS